MNAGSREVHPFEALPSGVVSKTSNRGISSNQSDHSPTRPQDRTGPDYTEDGCPPLREPPAEVMAAATDSASAKALNSALNPIPRVPFLLLLLDLGEFGKTAENGGAKLDHRAANRSCFWAE